MTESFIHAAFDPRPWVLLSSSAFATGLVIETNRAYPFLRRLGLDLTRIAARQVARIRDCSRLYIFGTARR